MTISQETLDKIELIFSLSVMGLVERTETKLNREEFDNKRAKGFIRCFSEAELRSRLAEIEKEKANA